MNNCRKALCVVTVLLFLSGCSKPAVTAEASSNEFLRKEKESHA